MRSPAAFCAVLLVLTLTACASDPSADTPPDAAGSPPARSGDPVDAFADACLASANWTRAQCTCAGRLADDELSDRARDFVLATLREDDAATARLRQDLSIEEATQAGLFMVRAGRECGGVTE